MSSVLKKADKLNLSLSLSLSLCRHMVSLGHNELKIGHQDSGSSSGHQGDVPSVVGMCMWDHVGHEITFPVHKRPKGNHCLSDKLWYLKHSCVGDTIV